MNQELLQAEQAFLQQLFAKNQIIIELQKKIEELQAAQVSAVETKETPLE